MSQHIFIASIVLFAGACLTVLVLGIRRSFKKMPARLAWVFCAGILFALAGMGGFFSAAFFAAGGSSMPNSVEWPPGYVPGVVRTTEGLYLAPLVPVGRLQIYDRNMKFLRGWQVDSSGGAFQVFSSQPGRIDVFVARARKHSVYSEAGDLLSSTHVSDTEYSRLPATGFSMTLPTRWWLWPFSSPFLSVLTMTIGLALMRVTDRIVSRHSRGPDSDAKLETSHAC